MATFDPNEIRKAVEEFTPRRPQKFQDLLPAKDVITELRHITGDTGSGKTSSGINQLAHQVFQNEPMWGGLCIDEKGVYWEMLSAMARHDGQEHDLIHLQIRADETDAPWTPPNRFSLTGEGNRQASN